MMGYVECTRWRASVTQGWKDTLVGHICWSLRIGTTQPIASEGCGHRIETQLSFFSYCFD